MKQLFDTHIAPLNDMLAKQLRIKRIQVTHEPSEHKAHLRHAAYANGRVVEWGIQFEEFATNDTPEPDYDREWKEM